MSFLKKHAEILYSYVIGIVSILISVIILLNLSLINKLNGKDKIDLHIHNVWDFINAFFGEIIRVTSNYNYNCTNNWETTYIITRYPNNFTEKCIDKVPNIMNM